MNFQRGGGGGVTREDCIVKINPNMTHEPLKDESIVSALTSETASSIEKDASLQQSIDPAKRDSPRVLGSGAGAILEGDSLKMHPLENVVHAVVIQAEVEAQIVVQPAAVHPVPPSTPAESLREFTSFDEENLIPIFSRINEVCLSGLLLEGRVRAQVVSFVTALRALVNTALLNGLKVPRAVFFEHKVEASASFERDDRDHQSHSSAVVVVGAREREGGEGGGGGRGSSATRGSDSPRREDSDSSFRDALGQVQDDLEAAMKLCCLCDPSGDMVMAIRVVKSLSHALWVLHFGRK